MLKPKLPRITRRLVMLSVLVVCLGMTVLSSGIRKTSAYPCCSPCFDCYDSCYGLPTNEEMNACYARCERLYCTNPYCDPGC
jgi:hypothetical protein